MAPTHMPKGVIHSSDSVHEKTLSYHMQGPCETGETEDLP